MESENNLRKKKGQQTGFCSEKKKPGGGRKIFRKKRIPESKVAGVMGKIGAGRAHRYGMHDKKSRTDTVSTQKSGNLFRLQGDDRG